MQSSKRQKMEVMKSTTKYTCWQHPFTIRFSFKQNTINTFHLSKAWPFNAYLLKLKQWSRELSSSTATSACCGPILYWDWGCLYFLSRKKYNSSFIFKVLWLCWAMQLSSKCLSKWSKWILTPQWRRGYQADCGELNLRTRLYSEQLQRGVTETGLVRTEINYNFFQYNVGTSCM